MSTYLLPVCCLYGSVANFVYLVVARQHARAVAEASRRRRSFRRGGHALLHTGLLTRAY